VSDKRQSNSEATEEAGSRPIGPNEADTAQTYERRGFLASARRNLSEDEAASPAGRRWLIAELERLDGEYADYKELQKTHSDMRVRLATLEEAQRRSRWLEILSYVSVSVGSAGIGAAPSYITADKLASAGWVMMTGAAILIIVGVLAKVKQ